MNSRCNKTYTVENIFNTMKRSSDEFIPSEGNIYFLYDLYQFFKPEFNLESSYIQFFIHENTLNLSITKQNHVNSSLNEMNCELKNEIEKKEQLFIPHKMIWETITDIVITYLVTLMFDWLKFITITIFYTSRNNIKIHNKNEINKLDA